VHRNPFRKAKDEEETPLGLQVHDTPAGAGDGRSRADAGLDLPVRPALHRCAAAADRSYTSVPALSPRLSARFSETGL